MYISSENFPLGERYLAKMLLEYSPGINDSFYDQYNETDRTSVTLAFSPIITVAYLIIYMPVFVGTIVGNLLVILAFATNARLRKVSNYFLLSLAVTDFLTGLFALPLNLTPRLIISPATCYETTRFNFFLPAFVFSGSSLYHLSVIAIDRLISVYCPLRYVTIVTPLRAKIALFVIWAYNVLFGFVPFFIPGGETDQWVCNGDHSGDNDVAAILVGIAIFIPVYFIGMLCLYAVLLRRVMQHIHKHHELTTPKFVSDTDKSEAKARARGLVTMAIVVGAFGICWLPTSFQFFFEIYFPYNDFTLIVVQTICEYSAFANSMVNPIIYARRNKEFHRGMKNAIKCTSSTEKRRNESQTLANRNGNREISDSGYVLVDTNLTSTALQSTEVSSLNTIL